MASRPIIISDCGGANARMGVLTSKLRDVTMPNYIAKSGKSTYIGDKVEECQKLVGLYYQHPIDRGYMTDLSTQQDIWDLTLDHDHLAVQAADCDLAMTLTPFTPSEIVNAVCEIAFEENEFESVFLTCPATMSVFNYKYSHPDTSFTRSSCVVCVDSGYSHTYIVPYFDNYALNYAIKRVDVGGKLLTNALKEMVSVRHWNMMEETFLINHIKETLCYVADDFKNVLKASAEGMDHAKSFVLPNYATDRTGHIKDGHEILAEDDQVLTLNNELFTVPELLFTPPAPLNQAGIAEAIVQSVDLAPSDMRGQLYSNILLTGGNTLIPGYKERLERELRSLVPQKYSVDLVVADDVIQSAFQGTAQFCQADFFTSFALKRVDYAEEGAISARFLGFS